MSQRNPTKRYNPVEVRQRILDQAIELFALGGYAATSVDQIAKSAGVTKGALYHHFESKEDILRVLYESYLAERVEHCSTIVASTDDLREQLSLLISEVFENAISAKGLLGLFLREREVLQRESFEDARRVQRRFYSIFEDVIRRGQDDGVFAADVRPRHAAYSLLGTLVWAEYWFDASRRDSKRFIDDTRRMLLRGLTAPTTPPPLRPKKARRDTRTAD